MNINYLPEAKGKRELFWGETQFFIFQIIYLFLLRILILASSLFWYFPMEIIFTQNCWEDFKCEAN